MARKKNQVRFLTSNNGDGIWSEYEDAVRDVDLNISPELFARLLTMSKKGVPWDCIVSNGAVLLARDDPNLFSHAVLTGYAIGTRFYAITSKANGKNKLLHSVRYRHNFTEALHGFDQGITAKRFRRMFPDGLIISLKPCTIGRRRNGGGGGGGGERKERPPISRGAMRRFQDAGIEMI